MAGVYIKGLGMPTECHGLRLIIYPNGQVLLPKSTYLEELNGVEAIPVPPHGRLIDADEFEKANAYYWGKDFINSKYEDCLCDLVNDAPTIIPAEEAKDND